MRLPDGAQSSLTLSCCPLSLTTKPKNKNKNKTISQKLPVDLCKQLVASKLVDGLHFYTLNQSANTTAILERLGLLVEVPAEKLDEGDTLKGTHIAA